MRDLSFEERYARRLKLYNDKPFKEWDGKTPLCLFDDDVFFFAEDDIYIFCEDNEIKDTKTLKLIICEPMHGCEVDLYELWEDEMHEDYELPKDIKEALDNLNAKIKALPPISWTEGRYKTIVDLDLSE